MKGQAINKIKQRILDNKLKTQYSLILIYIGLLTGILLYFFLIYNYLKDGKKLKKISNYVIQNLYYNQTKRCISHMYIIFINFILYKTKLLKNFYYNNMSNIDIYKDNYKLSINNIFELIQKNNNFHDDYYVIFSNYTKIYINNPYNISNNVLINMTNFQIIKLIISESLKFNYNIDDFLLDNEDREIYNSFIKNIYKISNDYLNFDFNGFGGEEIVSKISKNFISIPWILILVCVLIVFIIVLYSYIVYILNYYENFFLRKIINLNSKEFEDYLKHFEDLKYKLKNLENEGRQKTLANDGINEDIASGGNNSGNHYNKNEDENNPNNNINENQINDDNNQNSSAKKDKKKKNQKRRKKVIKKIELKK